jgi:hypothetical protein
MKVAYMKLDPLVYWPGLRDMPFFPSVTIYKWIRDHEFQQFG